MFRGACRCCLAARRHPCCGRPSAFLLRGLHAGLSEFYPLCCLRSRRSASPSDLFISESPRFQQILRTAPSLSQVTSAPLADDSSIFSISAIIIESCRCLFSVSSSPNRSCSSRPDPSHRTQRVSSRALESPATAPPGAFSFLGHRWNDAGSGEALGPAASGSISTRDVVQICRSAGSPCRSGNPLAGAASPAPLICAATGLMRKGERRFVL